MVVDDSLPDEWDPRPVNEVANPLQRHGQRLKGINPIPALEDVQSCPSNFEWTFPVERTLSFPGLSN